MNWAVGLAIAAAAIALGQLWTDHKATKVQRVIDLHRDLTTGEVGGARDRFSTLMWKHGERLAGRNVCHAPQWDEILPNVLGDQEPRGSLGRYRDDDHVAAEADAEPMRDLYAVLWCFERIEAGRAGRALDSRMLTRLIASHAVWWNEMTRNLTAAHTTHVDSLRQLVNAVGTPGLREWAAADFSPAAAGHAAGPDE